jgi:hypothetical protein
VRVHTRMRREIDTDRQSLQLAILLFNIVHFKCGEKMIVYKKQTSSGKCTSWQQKDWS